MGTVYAGDRQVPHGMPALVSTLLHCGGLKRGALLHHVSVLCGLQVGAGMYLHELEKKDFNALDPGSLKGVWGVSPLWLHAQLFLTSAQNKF